jgi:hypothetical protein
MEKNNCMNATVYMKDCIDKSHKIKKQENHEAYEEVNILIIYLHGDYLFIFL